MRQVTARQLGAMQAVLVRQQQFRPVHQRPRDRRPLLLPARQLVRPMLRPLSQSNPLQQRQRPLAIRPFAAQPTLAVFCSAAEAGTGHAYDACPRSTLARTADQVGRRLGADRFQIGMELGFSLFDDAQFDVEAWLAGEIERVRPQTIVCLGATAALALFGAGFRLMEQRGRWHALHDGTRALATVHPAWVLRQPAHAQAAAYAQWLADLRLLLAAP